jgi:hypothetical protein
MASLPESARDRLLALAQRWGETELFGANIAAITDSLKRLITDAATADDQRIAGAKRLVGLEDKPSIAELVLEQVTVLTPPGLSVGLVSALTERGAAITVEGLARGAFDFIRKPDGPNDEANAAIAATYFWTESSISGADNSESFLQTTNLDDWSHAWVFGGGVMIPFGNSIGALNLGARYHYGASATYLKKGDITDNPDGTINLNPRNSKTDLVLWQLGVSFAIPRSTGH